MSLEELKEAIDSKTLSIDLAQKYLKLYVADIDWQPHVTSLWSNSQKKFKDIDLAKEHVKRAISCTALLPTLQNVQIPNPPSNLLFWCTAWNQFNEHDWFELLIDVFKDDYKVIQNRKKIIELGVFDPIDVPPMTRQAFNWIYDKALENESFSDDELVNLKEKFKNLVRIYGGAVICNIFINHKLYVDKVFNWRSGYFFEKQIHKVYNLDQISSLKKAEILKTNSKYIKQIEKKVGAQ